MKSTPLQYPRIIAVIAAVVFLIAGVMLAQAHNVSGAPGDGRKISASTGQKEKLRRQVDTWSGAPQSGRNPASQQQTSLAAAASAPAGPGSRTDKPAAGVTGNKSTKKAALGHDHAAHTKATTGINAAGCFLDYGKPGEQCLPAGTAKRDGSLDCKTVRRQFPGGILVSGNDRFKLDTNGDRIACGRGDR